MTVTRQKPRHPSKPVVPNVTLSSEADKRRLRTLAQLAPSTKLELGQFMTPAPVAEFMTSLFCNVSQAEIKLLDPGAGIGSLTAAFVQRICSTSPRPRQISITAYEIDPALESCLRLTLEECANVAEAAGVQLNYEVFQHDFIEHAAQNLEANLFADRSAFTHIVANPPYRKIQTFSPHRKVLRRVGIEVTNLYAAFVALAVKMLVPNGELVAITPRSFTNGPYFLPFRKLLLAETDLRQIHILETRDSAFRDDAVLQENVIFHAVKASQSSQVVITSSKDADFSAVVRRQVSFSDVVYPVDTNLLIHIPANENDARIARKIRSLPCCLDDLGVSVSTGPVVDFRLREYIHQDAVRSAVPLIYPGHFYKGRVIWPKLNGKKPNAIENASATRKWLMPVGNYTLTRRFSSKEEKRRVITAILELDQIGGDWVGFENHLNVFHSQGSGLPLSLARGLGLFLNSTIVDHYFRLFNGHTQVNASDLRALPYPRREQLVELGEKIDSAEFPPQNIIDALIEQIIFVQYDTSS